MNIHCIVNINSPYTQKIHPLIFRTLLAVVSSMSLVVYVPSLVPYCWVQELVDSKRDQRLLVL